MTLKKNFQFGQTWTQMSVHNVTLINTNKWKHYQSKIYATVLFCRPRDG